LRVERGLEMWVLVLGLESSGAYNGVGIEGGGEVTDFLYDVMKLSTYMEASVTFEEIGCMSD